MTLSGTEVAAIIVAVSALIGSVGTALLQRSKAKRLAMGTAIESAKCDTRIGELEGEVRRLWDAVRALRDEQDQQTISVRLASHDAKHGRKL